MSKLEYTHEVGGVPTDADSVVLSDSGSLYGIKRSDDEVIVIDDGTVMTNVGTGLYEYDFNDPAYDIIYDYSIEVEYPAATFNFVVGELQGISLLSFGSYISRPDAEIYFNHILMAQPWEEATEREKEKALVTASKSIAQLSLRTFETTPQEIKDAVCEIALVLLDGIDPEIEFQNLAMVSQNYANVRSTYDRSFQMEHIEAGIMSRKAWNLIFPHLDVSKNIQLSRVS